MYDSNLNFDFDNKIYYHISDGKSNININLPISTPITNQYHIVKTKTCAKIKLLLTLSTLNIPDITINCKSKKYKNKIKLKTNKTNLIVFETNDSGDTWSIFVSYVDKEQTVNSNNITKEAEQLRIVHQDEIIEEQQKRPKVFTAYRDDNNTTKIQRKLTSNFSQTIVDEVTKTNKTIYPDHIKMKIDGKELNIEKI